MSRATGAARAARKPVVSVDDDIERIGRDIEAINRAIEIHDINAERADDEIERQITQLWALYDRLSEIESDGSDEFNRKITTKQVNVLKSIQDTMNKVRLRNNRDTPAMARLLALMHDRDYTLQEFELFVVATNLLRDFETVRTVLFSSLDSVHQEEIDKFFFEQVCTLILEGGGTVDQSQGFNDQILVLKILIRDLVAQILLGRSFSDAGQNEQLIKKLIAMTSFTATYGDERSFSENVSLLLSTLTRKDIAKGAFTGAVFAQVAVLNPALRAIASTTVSMVAEAGGLAVQGAISQPTIAAGTTWHVLNFVRNFRKSVGIDWVDRIAQRERENAIEGIFGPSEPLEWWNVLGLGKAIVRYGTKLLCGQVEVATDMGRDFKKAPSAGLALCKRAFTAVNSKIARTANRMASKGVSLSPDLLTKCRNVMIQLLDTEEFASIRDDAFIVRTLQILGTLDKKHGLTKQQLEWHLVRQIATHGITPAFKRQLRAQGDDSLDTVFELTDDEKEMQSKVFDMDHDSRYDPYFVDEGGILSAHEPLPALNAPTAEDLDRNWGGELERGQLLSAEREARSNVGSDRIVHQRTFQPPNPPQDEDKAASQKRKANKSEGAEGGKRTRRRKATTKKQKSKKNKRQSRRKSRRSSSRKAGRK